MIGAPSWLGCDRRGVETAPDVLRRAGIVKRLGAHDRGDIPPAEPTGDAKMKHLGAICAFSEKLAREVCDSLRGGVVPFVLGGDHSVALGSISASAVHHDRLGVIWIDAHGDVNTADTSPSGHIHGMPLAALMGFGDRRLTDIFRHGRKLDPRHVFLVGQRDLDPGEIELIAREGITLYDMEQITRRGIGAVVRDLTDELKARGLSRVHISLDVDALDPAFAPGTGTTAPDGMTVDELKTLIDGVSRRAKIVSCDLVEVNPVLDHDEKTIDLALDLAEFIAEKL